MNARGAAQAERAALCDLFLERGPDAPTLCEGWTALDLAVHLVIREHRPIAASGIALGGPFARHLARESARLRAERPLDALVATLRAGPPPWWRPADGLANAVEFFVHHEDLRRGNGDHTPRPPEQIAGVEEALWERLRRSAWLLTRRLGRVGLDLAEPDGRVIHARRAPAGHIATLSGRPGELTLYLTGRKAAAQVELDDSPAAAAVRATPFGL